jgi:CubicO group peptidase (beta-lactamase class C family)
MRSTLVRGIAILGVAAAVFAPLAPARSDDREAFISELNALAAQQGLPGYSAVLIRDGKVAWATGWGFADLEARVPATADTPYRLASVSKPIAAVVLMQLVESGQLDLDAPMNRFDVHAWFEPGGGSWAHYPDRYQNGAITVRHVLTHTSESTPPGEAYNYNGNIFGDLTWVVESVTRQSYPDVVIRRILDPLEMKHSSPGQLVPSRQDVASNLAKPYRLENGAPHPGTYPGFGLDPDTDVTPWHLAPAYRLPRETPDARRRLLGKAFTPLYSAQTAAGAIASVNDLAKFDIALDGGRLVSAASRDKMFTAARTSRGEMLPYGLGWFVETVNGVKIVWHYGWFPPTVSALYVKVPEERLTFIIISNCDGLSADTAWTAQGVRASPIVRVFLDHYVPRAN